jgi:hypothetical protein
MGKGETVASLPLGLFLYRRTAIGNHAHDIGVGDKLPIDLSFAPHTLHT